jgi:hypothetical protein
VKGVFILESYLKTMSYVHCRQSIVEHFGRQAPIKSAMKVMDGTNMVKVLDANLLFVGVKDVDT